MKYVVEVNGERLTVDLDGTHATIDGETFAVELTPVVGTPVRLVRVGEQVHRIVARRGAQRGAWALDVDGERVAARRSEAVDLAAQPERRRITVVG